jgi:tRNA-specific 2-thiouridylase
MSSVIKKIFVALSGGVDSSTTTAILLERGYDVSAVFMITHDQAHHAKEQAQKAADHLGIELHVLDMRKQFEQVLEYFCNEYKRARTPNPCVFCNRVIKFGKLWQFAKDHGSEYFATGHYVRVLKNKDCYGLYAADSVKDQSYALAMIDKSILPHLVFPMGDFDKNEVREKAAKIGLHASKSKESQEICFIPDDDYIAELEKMSPELIKPGKIIDSSGNVLGEHNGIHRYTIGQRRGLRIAMGKPYYVIKLDAENNTVTLGLKEEVMHKKLIANNTNWLIEKPYEPFSATVKIRYNHNGAMAKVNPKENHVEIEFDEPISAITPGQLAVFYLKNDLGAQVAGGAWIERAFD